jgi:hypothetical protein
MNPLALLLIGLIALASAAVLGACLLARDRSRRKPKCECEICEGQPRYVVPKSKFHRL